MSALRRLAWTEQSWLVLSCIAAATAAAFVAGGQTPTVGIGLIGLIVATVAIGLCVDGFIALCVGLAAAAGAVFLFQLEDVWSDDHFFTVLAVALAMLLLGWFAGQLGSAIREQIGADRRLAVGTAPAAALGSLGLLTRSAAQVRLEEEVTRAQTAPTPLTVGVITVRITARDLDAAAATRLRRSVARLVESLARSTDVPFAATDDAVGIILPSTTTAQAWEVLGPIVDAATRSTFADRASGERRELSECAELHSGMVELDPRHDTAPVLLEAALAAAAPGTSDRSGGR